jgi:hypothetical protein
MGKVLLANFAAPIALKHLKKLDFSSRVSKMRFAAAAVDYNNWYFFFKAGPRHHETSV